MILSRGDQAATIPEEEIEAIRKTVEGNYRVEPHPFLKCGQRVRVKCGSLSGIEGILVRKKSVFRLVLSVQMLAQSVAVEIDAADVEPVGTRGDGTSLLNVNYQPLKCSGIRFHLMESDRSWMQWRRREQP